MTARLASQDGSGSGLVPWALLPVLGLALIFAVIVLVPGVACREPAVVRDASSKPDLILLATLVASVSCVLAFSEGALCS